MLGVQYAVGNLVYSNCHKDTASTLDLTRLDSLSPNLLGFISTSRHFQPPETAEHNFNSSSSSPAIHLGETASSYRPPVLYPVLQSVSQRAQVANRNRVGWL